MSYKMLGSILVIVGCGGTGFALAAAHLREKKQIGQLLNILQYMYCELRYHLTPLPQLCRQAAADASGILHNVFSALARELDWQESADVCSCMQASLRICHDVPLRIRRLLLFLGKNLGRYDLEGQLQGLEEVQVRCKTVLLELENNQKERLRSYRTLGLCAGFALAILLL